MSIPQETIDLIKERLSIVDLIGETVQLKRAGRNFVGLCPFHSEKTGSFSVREEEGTYHCFGCQKSGTIFNFVMETRGFSFPEAVRFLAARAGVTIEENTEKSDEDQRAQEHRRKLREILALAETAYRAEFAQNKKAQSYIESRGLTAETIQTFRIGYAPRSWEFIAAKVATLLGERLEAFGGQKGLEALLLEVGLIKRRDRGESDAAAEGQENAPSRGTYDAFRDRIMFPITRSDGATIAFGGRTLENTPEAPKYINSSESAVYQKRKTLFGIHPALKSLRSSKQALLVEGNLDVILMAQRGLTNVVATCGTAASVDHAMILRRLVETVVIVFDGDEAGRKATARCYEVFLNSGVDVMAALLPEGEDPDSFARKHSAEECREYIETKSVPLLHVYIDSLLGGDATTLTPAVVGKIAMTISGVLARLKNPVEKEFSLRTAADKLGVSIESFDQMVREASRKISERESSSPNRRSYSGSGAAARAAQNSSPEAQNVSGTSTRPNPRRSGSQEPGPLRRDQGYSNRPSSRGEPVTPSFSGTKASSEEVAAIWQTLVVAVITEPRLAASVLEMPSLAEGAGELEVMPENVRKLLRELAASDILGVNLVTINEHPEKSPTQNFPELAALLQQNNLDAKYLLAKACRLLTIGGGSPQKAVLEVERAANRDMIERDIEALKIEESKADDPEKRARLAQEKLLRLRSLERLRPTNPSGS